jgi:hypothetical protein
MRTLVPLGFGHKYPKSLVNLQIARSADCVQISFPHICSLHLQQQKKAFGTHQLQPRRCANVHKVTNLHVCNFQLLQFRRDLYECVQIRGANVTYLCEYKTSQIKMPFENTLRFTIRYPESMLISDAHIADRKRMGSLSAPLSFCCFGCQCFACVGLLQSDSLCLVFCVTVCDYVNSK